MSTASILSLFRRPTIVDTRPLAVRSAGDCAAIHAASFAHPWTATEIETLATQPNVVADAALDAKGGKLFGFALSRLAADEAEILTIAVDPSQRRRGVAVRLLSAHLGRLQNEGVHSLFLEVDEQNTAARALYGRFGFETVGHRPGYYRARDGVRASALIMRRTMD